MNKLYQREEMITLVLETVGTVAYYAAKGVWWGASWLIYGRQETEEEKILREQREVIERMQEEIELMHTEIQELHPQKELHPHREEPTVKPLQIIGDFLKDRVTTPPTPPTPPPDTPTGASGQT